MKVENVFYIFFYSFVIKKQLLENWYQIPIKHLGREALVMTNLENSCWNVLIFIWYIWLHFTPKLMHNPLISWTHRRKGDKCHPGCCKVRIECMAGSLNRFTGTDGKIGGPDGSPGFVTPQRTLVKDFSVFLFAC